MKYFCFFILTIIFFFSAKASFVEGLEDIPLPAELTQTEDTGLSFGNEEIRFIEMSFESKTLSFDKVISFYKETLPQMGWKITTISSSKLVSEREGESLEINRESASPLVIRLTLKSKN